MLDLSIISVILEYLRQNAYKTEIYLCLYLRLDSRMSVRFCVKTKIFRFFTEKWCLSGLRELGIALKLTHGSFSLTPKMVKTIMFF